MNAKDYCPLMELIYYVKCNDKGLQINENYCYFIFIAIYDTNAISKNFFNETEFCLKFAYGKEPHFIETALSSVIEFDKMKTLH